MKNSLYILCSLLLAREHLPLRLVSGVGLHRIAPLVTWGGPSGSWISDERYSRYVN